jgi:hypothetical protein
MLASEPTVGCKNGDEKRFSVNHGLSFLEKIYTGGLNRKLPIKYQAVLAYIKDIWGLLKMSFGG